MKKLLFTAFAIVITGSSNAIDEATFEQKAKEFAQKTKKIKEAYSSQGIDRLAKICALDLSPKKSKDYMLALREKVRAVLQCFISAEDIIILDAEIQSAVLQVKGEVLEISYNKLGAVEVSQLFDDFHQALQYCSKKHSLKEHGYYAARTNALVDCLKVCEIKDAEDKLRDFERTAIEQDSSEYKKNVMKEFVKR